MKFRHEWKHEINVSDLIALRQRLRAVAEIDPHAVNGKYEIRSLYFDNLMDKVLREKLDGVNTREKFRIRFYNNDSSLIHLEKKRKQNNLCSKETAVLSEAEAQAVAEGRYDWMKNTDRKLIQELYCKMKLQGLLPKTIVDYTREAFIYPPGNVRVTMDYDIRTGIQCTDFLNPECVMVPACKGQIILEVKWDSFLPSIIRDAVQLEGRRTSAFSKYAACRIYG